MSGTRLTIVVETEFTPEQLRQAVADLDRLDSAPEPGIAPEHVTAYDVLMFAIAGDLTLVPLLGVDPRARVEAAGGDLHTAFDGVVVNTMEPLS